MRALSPFYAQRPPGAGRGGRKKSRRQQAGRSASLVVVVVVEFVVRRDSRGSALGEGAARDRAESPRGG